MLNRIALFLILLATWLTLSGFFSTFFIFLGIFSCTLSIFIISKMDLLEKRKPNSLIILLTLPSYCIWLIKEIILSSMDVTLRMWQLEPDISPEIAWIQTNIKDDLRLTILGNSVTLTPGTVTTDMRNDGMIQIHALTSEGIETFRKGEMTKKVESLI